MSTAHQRITTERLDRYVLANLPATYSDLWPGAPIASGDKSRAIDRTLQRLQGKGLITFTREGRKIVWHLVRKDTP